MDTLVLSQGYEPIDRISWQKAITLFFMDKVEILQSYDDREIRSPSKTFKMPSVIRWLKTFTARTKSVKFSRQNVYTRDKGKCAYCAIHVRPEKTTYDHVVPRRQGGKTKWENVVIACIDCNQKKGGRTPEEAGMRLLTRPERPKSLAGSFRHMFIMRRKMPEQWKEFLPHTFGVEG